MAKLRHLAIKTMDPAKLARFYEEVFDMEVVMKSESGSVFMTDGYLSLALLVTRGLVPPGIDHFGFHVDDMEETGSRLVKAGIIGPKVRDNDPPFAEKRTTDPDGNMIDLSVHGYDRDERQADRGDGEETKVDAMAEARAGAKAKETEPA